MTTARDIVKSALRKISVVGTGSAMSNEDAQDGLKTLNSMMASMSVEGDVVYSHFVETFPLDTNVSGYTIGEGGDFDTAIPSIIKAMTYKRGVTDYQVSSYTDKQYANISQKNTLGIPTVYYFNADFPLATIQLYPVPSQSGTVTIYSEKPLTSFETLDTVYNFPAEYQSMLEFNLAVWIAPEYEREAPQTIKNVARRTFNTVQAANKRNNMVKSSLDVPTSNDRSWNGETYGDYS
ncbi:MAG: hypothetical protein CBC71_06340 [Rhodobacteraceae bacterium TMED111]|nr:hypothetical protein [Marinovum sp.]OUV41117.1 MAG: hypothetical protein CBC71_06340 [Rhodobacteraceae bacterium TMED111]|tara:strand:+ start:4068 stop:4775 length:708 start_codon:yes stop_codon:yes gene_type:complete